MVNEKVAIITGITGQDGAYLSQFLIEKKYKVIGLIRKDVNEGFFGLKYLDIFDKVELVKCNLLDLKNISDIIKKYKPIEIYNLAAQSSVGLSFEKPLDTVDFNIMSVAHLLESIKAIDKSIKFYQASSSDMFGNVDVLPITEKTIIQPASPYAISKVTGHWLTINYRESYNLKSCCGILFNHESYLRGNNFFVKKVIKTAIDIKSGREKELRVGNIDVRRDFGYAPDYVRAMWLMLQQDNMKEYLICSGRSVSLREIIEYVFDKLNISKDKIIEDKKFFRPNEIKNIYGTNEKARVELGWEYDKTFFDVLDLLIKEELGSE